ncbi:MAG: hypothetical protein KDE27_15135 [Planctomycetes bacterium]|nr:hypothetical protein [Planctomycetota bacterium]
MRYLIPLFVFVAIHDSACAADIRPDFVRVRAFDQHFASFTAPALAVARPTTVAAEVFFTAAGTPFTAFGRDSLDAPFDHIADGSYTGFAGFDSFDSFDSFDGFADGAAAFRFPGIA